jgi:hypothetical protein
MGYRVEFLQFLNAMCQYETFGITLNQSLILQLLFGLDSSNEEEN